jgi:hypothetical protein
LAFQILSDEEVCNPKIKVYKTAEGFYLTKFVINNKSDSIFKHPEIIPAKQTTQVQVNMFQAAESDSARLNQIQIYKELNVRNCYAISNSVNLISKISNDKYHKIKDIYGNELIFYVQNKNVYIPNCMKIKQISIRTGPEFNNPTICTEGIEIEIIKISETNNRNATNTTERVTKNKKVYLYSDKIIAHHTHRIDCKTEDYKVKIQLSNNTVVNRYYDNKARTTMIEIKYELKSQQKIDIINNNLTEINCRHQSQILETIDYNRLEAEGIFYESGRFYTQDILHVKFKSIQDKYDSFINYLFSKWFYFKISVISIISIFALIFIISLSKFVYNKINKLKPKRKIDRLGNSKSNIRDINLIKAFLPEKREETKDINMVSIRKTNTLNSILDAPTQNLLNRLRTKHENISRSRQEQF